jgi:hypothetical protein
LKLFHFVIVVFSLAVLAASCAFAQTYPAPYLNEPLVPTSAAPGGAAFVLTVNGSGFVSGAGIKWNGVALITTFANHNQLTAQVPASKIAKAGTAYITVSNPIGGGTSNIVPFNIAQPASSLAWKTMNTSTTAGSPGVVADFNGDGIPDLAVFSAAVQQTATVSILLGIGNGTFSAKSQLVFTSAGNSFAMAAADFNQDGNIDLAVFNSGDCFKITEVEPCIDVYFGNGDGTFNLGPQGPSIDGDFFFAAPPADFNRDGYPDLALSTQPGEGPPEVSIYLVNQTSIGLNGYVDGGCFSSASGIAVGDFNEDGILDLAISGQTCIESVSGDLPLAIFLGNGDGTFTAATMQPVTSLVEPVGVFAADFDGDGILDLAVVDPHVSSLVILHGNGDGTFNQLSGEPAASSASSVSTSDINGDGKLDLIVSTSSGNSLYLGNGNGTFQNALTIPAPPNSAFLGVADFNGDGHPDLSFTTSQGISVLLQQSGLPVAQFSTNVLSFGNQPMNVTSAPMEMFLLNSGSAPLHLSSIAVAGPNSGDFTQSNNCGKVLSPGARCKFYVTFTPLALGQRSAALRIMDNAAKSTQGVPLFGTGVAAH